MYREIFRKNWKKICIPVWKESSEKLYDAHVKRMKLLLDKQSEEEFNTSKIVILSELTKLRQICCDPALLFEEYKGESAKLEMCVDLIRNAVENGHKILVFSQFTTMLSRLADRLEKEENRVLYADRFDRKESGQSWWRSLIKKITQQLFF